MTVARVLAQADVGDQRQSRHFGPQRRGGRAARCRRRPRRPSPPRPSPRGCRTAAPRAPRVPPAPRLPHDLVDRALGDPVESLDRAYDALARAGEQRHHERRRGTSCVSRTSARSAPGPAQAPQPGDGKAAHGRSVRQPLRERGASTAPRLEHDPDRPADGRRCPRPPGRLDLDLDAAASCVIVVVPALELDPLAEELPDGADRCHRRQRQQHARRCRTARRRRAGRR